MVELAYRYTQEAPSDGVRRAAEIISAATDTMRGFDICDVETGALSALGQILWHIAMLRGIDPAAVYIGATGYFEVLAVEAGARRPGRPTSGGERWPNDDDDGKPNRGDMASMVARRKARLPG
jgi:hypothetical protein